MAAGEATTVDSTHVEPATQVTDLDGATSWRSGRLAFRIEQLAQVLEDVNRYSQKRIVIADADIGDFEITGTVVGTNVSGRIASLESTLGIGEGRGSRRFKAGLPRPAQHESIGLVIGPILRARRPRHGLTGDAATLITATEL